MSNSQVDAFADLCAKAVRKAPGERLRIGPTYWLLGSPAPADPGMVGVATSVEQTVFVRKEDVVEVREWDGRHLVCISADANVMLREETVGRPRPKGCGCHEKADGTLAKKKGEGGRTGPIIIDCQPICYLELTCAPVYDERSKAVIMVCRLERTCDFDPCGGGQTV
jgi:hypothetical protein